MQESLPSSAADPKPTGPAPKSTQFSLRAILLIFVVISVLLAPIPMFGKRYAISMLFSLVVLLVTWRISVSSGAGGALAISLIFAFSGVLGAIASLPYLFHTLCNIAACLLLLILNPKPKVSLAVLFIALLIPYTNYISDGINRLGEYEALKVEFPILSVTERLAPLEILQVSATPSTATLATEVSASLDEQESNQRRRSWRVHSLEKLHDESYRKFVTTQGFGVSRMGNPLSPWRFELAPASEAPFPLAVAAKYTTAPDTLHTTSIDDFNNANRIGYVASPQKAAGFAGHAFTRLPEKTAEDSESSSWQLTQLQLISLLRHETPVAYITETLPEMQGIETYPHRVLNEFEEKALPQLRTQRDTVIDEASDSIQMLGAVRAGKSCLDCHTNHQRGDLLGAFSYQLNYVNN